MSGLCRDIGMPSPATVRRFLNGSRPEQVAFRAAYDRALAVRERMLWDDILATIDDADGDWVEQRNEAGEPYWVHDPSNLARARRRIDVMCRELERLIAKRKATEQAGRPVTFAIKQVDFMDLPPEVRARYKRPGGDWL